MTSPAEHLDEMLAALTPEVAAALRGSVPVDLRDQHDAAATEAFRTLVQMGAHLGSKPVRPPGWASLPGWLRLSAVDTMLGFFAGTGRTCLHATPHRAEPLFAAIWRPGLVVCSSCRHLLAPRRGPDAHTCDGCGRVCPPTPEEGVRPVTLQLGAFLFSTGTCPECTAPALLGASPDPARALVSTTPLPPGRRGRRRGRSSR